MPPRRVVAALSSERIAAILEEALRQLEAGIAVPVDLAALRRALETKQAKGPRSLVELIKVGWRRALDRIARAERKTAARG